MQASAFAMRRQRGVATVLVTVVLLLAVGLVALYSSRSAIVEQRLSANEVRAKQALAAANAGIDHALAYMRKSNPVANAIVSQGMTQSGGTNAVYRVRLVAYVPGNFPTCPAAVGYPVGGAAPSHITAEILAVSCGWSDDESAVQRVMQRLQTTPATAGAISTPLVTRGVSDLLTGGASVLNYFNDLTVWSGGSLLGQSNTGKTFIRDVANSSHTTPNPTHNYRNVGNSPACNNPPAGYTCSTQGSVLGHDTVGGDTILSSQTADEFFQYFMGETKDVYRENVATWVVDVPGGTTLATSDSTDVASVANKTDAVIWVEGNLTLPNVGTATNPVILVVNGNLTLSANAVVNGIVFVTGQVTGNGNPEIYGSLITSEGASITGNPLIIYDPLILGRASNLGRAAKLHGTWRDW